MIPENMKTVIKEWDNRRKFRWKNESETFTAYLILYYYCGLKSYIMIINYGGYSNLYLRDFPTEVQW